MTAPERRRSAPAGSGGRAAARPSPVGTRARHLIEYLLFRALLWLVSRLSWDGTRRLGRLLGSFAFGVIRLRRRVALDNLRQAFPGWTEGRRMEVARQCYRHFGITFLELCRLPRLSREQLTSRVRLAQPDLFNQARVEGRGAVLVTGHVGNWELSGASLPGFGFPTCVLVGRQHNRRIDAFVNRARESAGLRVLWADEGLRPILRALRANRFVAFLSDQDAGRDGVFVPFLGRLASTPLGPVRFARSGRCPIIFGYAIRQPDGTYLLEMPPPLRVREDLLPEEAELEATRRTVELLEDVIRRYPEQWFWMHRRWKTRPAAMEKEA
jgi:KDO2-lipid IV(A) lauroyltransferase